MIWTGDSFSSLFESLTIRLERISTSTGHTDDGEECTTKHLPWVRRMWHDFSCTYYQRMVQTHGPWMTKWKYITIRFGWNAVFLQQTQKQSMCSTTFATALTTPTSLNMATSFSNCLGYLSKSSPSANCVGFTMMEAITTSFCDRAARASERCPRSKIEQ